MRESLFLRTWLPSARSREVRLRRPLMALSTCSCRVSEVWEELASKAWPRRMASESRARPCQTSRACCSTYKEQRVGVSWAQATPHPSLSAPLSTELSKQAEGVQKGLWNE